MYPLDPNRTAEPVKDEQAIEKFWSYQGQMESEDDENEKCPWKPDVPPEFRKEFEQREAKRYNIDPFKAFGGAPSGGPTKCCDTWGKRISRQDTAVPWNEWLTYEEVEDLKLLEEVQSPLSPCVTVVGRRDEPVEVWTVVAEGIDDVAIKKREERLKSNPGFYGYYKDGVYTTDGDKLGLHPSVPVELFDRYEAVHEYYKARNHLYDEYLNNPKTQPRWVKLLITAKTIANKMLQQMESFLATRGEEPVFHLEYDDIPNMGINES